MSDNRKYYYLKLKDNFFESDSMILMESMKDGYLYSNILLKLYLKSLKDDGKLVLNGRIPYNAQMIASVTKHQVGTVEKALTVFEELGLVEILDNGIIYMLDIQNFIGESSTEADRKREYRARIETEKASGQMSRHLGRQNSPEIEIDIEKEIDIKEKEKGKEKSSRFVPPTPEEVKAYCREKGYNVDPDRFIDFYEAKGWMIGKNKMKDWKAAVRTWVKRDNNTQPQDKPISYDLPPEYQEMYKNLGKKPPSPDDPFQ